MYQGMIRSLCLIVTCFLLTVETNAYAATVFYLHGKIIEDEGDNAVHPIYGIYEYGKIISALQEQGHRVISEVRPTGTDREMYASLVANQIRALVSEGTTPDDIVVVGFSKGAQIAILVSQQLPDTNVRFVFQAVCGSWLTHFQHLRVHGNILSQYETSDTAGSCKTLFDTSGIDACEIPISTGLKHGAFYSPIDEWFITQQEWISEGTCTRP